MITNLEKQNIYLHDNFFEEYHVIYDFVVEEFKKINPVYQDCGEAFFHLDFGFPEEWLDLLTKIGIFVEGKYGNPCSIKSNALNLVVYEDGSYKEPHKDNLHVFLDENGLEIKEEFNYTSIFYLNDNFTGGKLKFDLLDVVIDPIPGRLVVFPSDLLHSVSKVGGGTRFIVNKFWRVKNEN